MNTSLAVYLHIDGGQPVPVHSGSLLLWPSPEPQSRRLSRPHNSTFWVQKILQWISAEAHFLTQLIASEGVNCSSLVCLQSQLLTWDIQPPSRLHQISPSSLPHHLVSYLMLIALKTHYYFSPSSNKDFRLFSLSSPGVRPDLRQACLSFWCLGIG